MSECEHVALYDLQETNLGAFSNIPLDPGGKVAFFVTEMPKYRFEAF